MFQILFIFLPGVVFGEKLGFAKYYSAKLIFRPATIEKMAKTGHFSTILMNKSRTA